MVSIRLVSYFIRMVSCLLINNFFLTIIFLLLQNSLPLYLVLSPNGVIMLFKGYNSALTSSEMPLPDPVDTYVGGICFKSTLKNNRNIRFLFLNDYVSTPQAVSKCNRSVENILWKKVWTLPNRYLLVNKVKEIYFKLIQQYYPVETFVTDHSKVTVVVFVCSSSTVLQGALYDFLR